MPNAELFLSSPSSPVSLTIGNRAESITGVYTTFQPKITLGLVGRVRVIHGGGKQLYAQR
jgi:hypothetical protein